MKNTENGRLIKVVALSDTHGFHNEITEYNEIPDGDILLIAGDLTTYGKRKELFLLDEWLGTLSHRHKIVVAGNHDKICYLQRKEETKAMITNATYLQDESVTVEGIKIYGTPWTPTFYNWYFMHDRGSEEAKSHWAQMPDDTDILLTHGPPLGKCDYSVYSHEHVGCEDLSNRLEEVNVKYCVFGHIHQPGYVFDGKTHYINAAICDESYVPRNKPSIFHVGVTCT